MFNYIIESVDIQGFMDIFYKICELADVNRRLIFEKFGKMLLLINAFEKDLEI